MSVAIAVPLEPELVDPIRANVLHTPHTAGLSMRENERIVALFVENLGRYLRGDSLRNRVDPELLY